MRLLAFLTVLYCLGLFAFALVASALRGAWGGVAFFGLAVAYVVWDLRAATWRRV